MMSCLEEMVLRIWGFCKRVSWDWIIEVRVGSSAVEACGQVLQISTDRDLKHHKICHTLRLGSDRMVTIVWLAKTFKNCVSPHVAMDQSQEINKLFVSETTASACVLYLYMYLYRSCDWFHHGIQHVALYSSPREKLWIHLS